MLEVTSVVDIRSEYGGAHGTTNISILTPYPENTLERNTYYMAHQTLSKLDAGSSNSK